ncbi:MAG: monovalent cation/H+ antiporter complex subunit F [Chloroflexota bacterium]|jgi:multisubunit Na+/H+ antiporter MnhF subunit
MGNLLQIVLYMSLLIHLLLLAVAVWRVWHGENVADRLIGVDLVTTLVLAVLVLVSLIYRASIYIDVALALAALGFVGTIALAKYVVDDKLF